MVGNSDFDADRIAQLLQVMLENVFSRRVASATIADNQYRSCLWVTLFANPVPVPAETVAGKFSRIVIVWIACSANFQTSNQFFFSFGFRFNFFTPCAFATYPIGCGICRFFRSRDEIQLDDTTLDGFLGAAKHFCNISGAPIASLPSFNGSESSKVFLRKGRSEYLQQPLSIGICLKCQRRHPWPRVLVEVTLILVGKHNLFRKILRH